MSSTIDRAPERMRRQPPAKGSAGLMQKGLLVCGVVVPLYYAAINVVAALRFKGYSSISQTISELSAIGAPTRPLWLRMGIVYELLVIAFGVGVWMSADGKRALRVVGGVLVATGVIGFAWPPMHLRGAGTSLTDTMHIVFTAVTVLPTLIAIGLGATAFGKRFRIYSIATIAISIVFGGLTGIQAPRVPKNLPTPWLGVWERISIAAWMLWIAVLAVALLRARREQTQAGLAGRPDSSLAVRPAA
jgi:hypothetical protein